MKSIPTIFLWDKINHIVIDKPLKMIKWVFEGKGIATRMYDGIAIQITDGHAFRRFLWRPGESVPNGFIRLQDSSEQRPNLPIPGWVPIPNTFKTKPAGPDERALRYAWAWLEKDLNKQHTNSSKPNSYVNPYIPSNTSSSSIKLADIPNGTYELCGPGIRGNKEGFPEPVLLRHGSHIEKNVPRTFAGLSKFLEQYEGEGIVWHYDTGYTTLMAKIKRADFGFKQRISKADLEMAYGQSNQSH